MTAQEREVIFSTHPCRCQQYHQERPRFVLTHAVHVRRVLQGNESSHPNHKGCIRRLTDTNNPTRSTDRRVQT